MKKEQSGIGDTDLNSEKPLQSWKEIAAYLERDQRTARRWEKEEALPIRRHREGRRSSVYAYRSELESWRAEREPKVSKTVRRAFYFGPGIALVLGALVVGLSVWFVEYGPIFNPPNPFVEAADGIKVRQVWVESGADSSGEPSPDGTLLSCVDWTTGDLAVRDLISGANRRLTEAANWFETGEFAGESAFSPDGSLITYIWHNSDSVDDLRVVGVDGSGSRILYRNDQVESIRLVDWLPDAAQILVMLRQSDGVEKLALVSAIDGSVRILRTVDWLFPGTASLSPDGRFIVYDYLTQRGRPERDVSLLRLDDMREVSLVRHDADDLHPFWTLDGEGILFASDRSGAMGLWALRVIEGKPEGSPQLVKPDIGRFVPMGLTQDGTLYYGLETGMPDVYSIGIDLRKGKIQGKPTRLDTRFVGSNFSPDWSSDGGSLAYVSRRTPSRGADFGSRIIIRNVATGDEREIKPELLSLLLFRWSPDGRTFVARGQDANGRTGIFLIGAQTGEVTTVFHTDPGIFVGFPSWSPDGQGIFYQKFNANKAKHSLVHRNLGNGLETEFLQVTPPEYPGFLVPSRDGKSLAYVIGNRRTGEQAIHFRSIGETDSRELVKVRREGFAFSGLEWTEDDQEIFFVQKSGEGGFQVYELMVVSTEGGEPRRLEIFKEYIRDLRLHPNKDQLTFAMGKREVEVWVMEDFLASPIASK